jgi:microcystin degradation protein MlrC
VDLYETGYRAGKRCMELLAGETLYCEACQLPLLLPPAGYTTNAEPFKSLMDSAKALVAQGTLVDVSIFVAQPWLDIPQIASTVLAIAKDPQAAKQAAAQLAQKLWDIKDGMWPQLVSVDEIITIAEENRTGKPVILADSADSPNGGCVGDSPMVALCLQARNSSLKAAMAVRDEAAVDQAFQMGVGATGKFSVGGKLTPGVPGPFEAEGTVLALHENDPVTGKHARMGKAATVRFGNLYMILCKQGSSTRTPDTYSDLGIDPAQCDLLVIKANTSFRAFYKDMTDLIYVGDTPGAGASDLRKLPFRNLPSGMFPFSET